MKGIRIRIIKHTPHTGSLALNRWYYDKIGSEYRVISVSPLFYRIADNFRPAEILKDDCEILNA